MRSMNCEVGLVYHLTVCSEAEENGAIIWSR